MIVKPLGITVEGWGKMRKIDDRTLTPAQKQKILEKYENTCGYCFGIAEEVDHILPWSYLHDDTEDNLIASCWLCNILY